MNIPDEVLAAVADRFADIDTAKPNNARIDFHSAARRGVYREHAVAAAQVIAEWARKEALKEAETAIANITQGYVVRGVTAIRLTDATDALHKLVKDD